MDLSKFTFRLADKQPNNPFLKNVEWTYKGNTFGLIPESIIRATAGILAMATK